jgi:hypothetical protein
MPNKKKDPSPPIKKTSDKPIKVDPEKVIIVKSETRTFSINDSKEDNTKKQ